MAAILCVVLLLLVFSFIRTGVNGEDGLIFPEHGYDITFPCEEDSFCFHIWQLSTSEPSDYIAIVSNGEIQTAKSENKDLKCTLQIKDLTAEDVERHRCQQRPDVSSPYNTPSATPEVNLMPGKTVSLQCVLLSNVEQGHCYTQLQRQQVSLAWVDETGTEIQEDSQRHIRRESSCDITLTLTLQSPQNKKFRCQATVDEQVQTSVEFRVPALKRKGRGLIVELEPENQGRNQDVVGAAVGVVGCAGVALLVAVFVVNKRRTSNPLPDESCYTISTINVTNADDVIYADIILPLGSDRVLVHESESSEYACIQYK